MPSLKLFYQEHDLGSGKGLFRPLVDIAFVAAYKFNKSLSLENYLLTCELLYNPISQELFSKENITAKRPGSGISPMKWDSIIGTAATRDYRADDLI